MEADNPFARLPAVDAVLEDCADLVALAGHAAVVGEVRAAIDAERAALVAASGSGVSTTTASAADLAGRVRAVLVGALAAGPRKVINAAGVVVHTNLGRAPLSPAAIEAMVAAAGYCDLETDLETGGRGSRGEHVDGLLRLATGGEAAMAVNSCAAALVLALAALAAGRQVPVSRGQLVEIGGSFRLPEIMAASGAQLLEVGTTNRTRAADYHAGTDVGALLTVHPSNFTQEGFVTQPSLAEVAAVAHERGVPLIHDAGAGLLVKQATGPLAGEATVTDDLMAGADLVLASGDKLLGGPQAGLIVGRADLVERCRRHPLARAVRLDKLRLAALSATLRQSLASELPPVLGLLQTDVTALIERTEALAAAVGGEVATVRTMIGGGSAPGVGADGPGVTLALGSSRAGEVAAQLRGHTTPVVVRVHDGALILDLRTVDPADDDELVVALAAALPPS